MPILIVYMVTYIQYTQTNQKKIKSDPKSDIYGKKGQFRMKPQLIFTKFTLGKS